MQRAEKGDWNELQKRAERIEGLGEVQTKLLSERGSEIINAKLLNTSQELETHSTAMEKELGSGWDQEGQPQALLVGEKLVRRKDMVPFGDEAVKG